MNYLKIAVVLLASTLMWSTASAAQWRTRSSQAKDGFDYVAVDLKQGKYELSFNCNNSGSARKSGRGNIAMTLHGKSFPNLYAKDDVSAKLTFRLDLPGGATWDFSTKAWYYGGDSAWTGSFNFINGDAYTYFGDALSMTLLAPNGKKVLVFSMKGSSKAAKTMKRICR